MKKLILICLLLFPFIMVLKQETTAFTDIAKPYTFVARDTIKASKMNANYDSLYARTNDLYDSLEINFLRFKDFRDSTIDSIKTNRIMSNPSIDSIQGMNVLRGNPDIDSISGLNVLRGNPDIDSISGTTKFTGVKTFVDAVNVDSLKSTKGINATTGGFSSTVSVDSLFSTKGIKATTFNGAVTGTYGTFACSLFDNTTYRAVVTARYCIVGNSVTLEIPPISGTSSAGILLLQTIPAAIRPSASSNVAALITNNGSNVIGTILVSNSAAFTFNFNAGSLDAGTGGTPGLTITYLL